MQNDQLSNHYGEKISMELTRTDQRLISALKLDARKTVSQLARELDLSRTTVQKRIGRLEEGGVITGYGVRLGHEYLDSSFQVYVNLVVDPRNSDGIAASLGKMAEVEALLTVSGKIDLIALVRVDSPGELDRILDRIGGLDGVRDTDSAIVLSTRFDRR